MEIMLDWSRYPNFRASEFECSHTGKNEMRPEFMEAIQKLRLDFNRPFIITSGYRDITHPVEYNKAIRGEHTLGLACDISIRGEEALRLVSMAYSHGFRRLGVQQKGERRFIHLGLGDKYAQFPATIWSY
jgi:uncharacterized protein YcbK (DUF882 family)